MKTMRNDDEEQRRKHRDRERARRARVREKRIADGEWLGQGARNRAKIKCPEGHAYTVENTYVTRAGGRVCKTCRRVRARRLRLEG